MSTLTVDMAGCWYDSHRGCSDICREVLGDALRLGMPDPDTGGILYADVLEWDGDGSLTIEGDEADITEEDLIWASEAAEAYLGTLAPDGYWVGWFDGDFGMYPIEAEEA